MGLFVSSESSEAVTADEPSNALSCTSVDQWFSPEADNYQFLRVARSIDSLQWQSVADKLLMENKDSKNNILHEETINLAMPEAEFKQKLHDAALAVSSSCSLPADLANLVYQDAQAMALATRKIMPEAQHIIMKLELFGDRVCSRWHQDYYVCRSLVAYNCSGTDYTVDSNVDFYELEHCGNNDHIIRDKSQIYSANVGDIVMIKGKKFPGSAKGLVHKSPEVRYNDIGDVQSRILLKVDIQDLAEDADNTSCTVSRTSSKESLYDDDGSWVDEAS